MRQNLMTALNQMLTYTWWIVFIGVLVALWTERKLLMEVFKKNSSKNPWFKMLIPLWKRLVYILGGLALVFLSFALVNTLLDYFHNLFLAGDAVMVENAQPSAFFSWLLKDGPYMGFYGVFLITISGYALILSAGRKWLKNLAGILLIFTFLLLFTATLGLVSTGG